MKSKKQTHKAKSSTKKKTVGKKKRQKKLLGQNLMSEAATARRTPASAWFVASPMATLCPEKNG